MANKNKRPLALAIISGYFLLLSGTTGVVPILSIESIILRYLDMAVIRLIFYLILIVASLGGISVMLGGFLIYKKNVSTGKILITIGSGSGILSVIMNILLAISSQNLTVSWFLSFGTIGIMLAILAKLYAKKGPVRKGKRKMGYFRRFFNFKLSYFKDKKH